MSALFNPMYVAAFYLERGAAGVKVLLAELPEDQAFDVSLWVARTARAMIAHRSHLHDLIDALPTGSRKKRAHWVATVAPERYRPALIAHLSGKPTRPALVQIVLDGLRERLERERERLEREREQ